jgi:hypothetical protein
MFKCYYTLSQSFAASNGGNMVFFEFKLCISSLIKPQIFGQEANLMDLTIRQKVKGGDLNGKS